VISALRLPRIMGGWLAVLVIIAALPLAVLRDEDRIVWLYDAVLIGVGIMGAATASILARSLAQGRSTTHSSASPTALSTAPRSQRLAELGALGLATAALMALAAPFLTLLALKGGAYPSAVPAHLLILGASTWAVACACLAARARGARPSALAAVVIVLILVVVPPAAMEALASVVRIEQEQTVYVLNGDTSRTRCEPTPSTRTREEPRSEFFWWLAATDPLLALADASVRGPAVPEPWRESSLLAWAGGSIDDSRDPHPRAVTLHECGEGIVWDSEGVSILREPRHAPFWPVTVLLMIGAGLAMGLRRRPR